MNLKKKKKRRRKQKQKQNKNKTNKQTHKQKTGQVQHLKKKKDSINPGNNTEICL